MSTEENKPKLEEEMTPEELKQQQESEDFLLSLTEDDMADPDKVDEINKRLADAKTTIHQKRHFREKLAELTKKPADDKEEKKPEKKEDAGAGNTTSVDRTVAIEFRQDHPELSKDVVKEVLQYAKSAGIDPEEALTRPLIKTFIEKENNKADVDDASIAPGNKKAGTGAEKKDWSNASQADIEKQRNRILNGQ